jgi:hypothetical protein
MSKVSLGSMCPKSNGHPDHKLTVKFSYVCYFFYNFSVSRMSS